MNTDFIGQDADERHKEAIAAAIRTMREITIRMSNEEVFGQTEFLTEVLPAVILDQIGCWGYGDSYEDLNTVVLATQKLHDKLAQWEEGEYHPEGLGCKWSDSHYEGKFINLDLPHIKP